MANKFSRREFLKIGGAALGSLAFRGVEFPPGRQQRVVGLMGRVAYDSINVYDAPRLDATTLSYRFRDELLHIYARITSPDGPDYNRLWYRVWGGYIHSANIQESRQTFNPVLDYVPTYGQVAELTVPYTQPYSYSKAAGWTVKENYLLYFESVHWLTDVVGGPDGKGWYQITDELWSGHTYYVPATHLRPIPDHEITPISPDVAPEEKRIEVDLSEQTLNAFEGERVVFSTKVSTGIRTAIANNGFPTRTPTGTHNVQSKMPSKNMGGNSRLTDGLSDRALPGVPWTMFFAEGGYALHGTYWHNNFGWPMSRGCINMKNADAKWLFRWITPEWQPGMMEDGGASMAWETRGFGTRLIVTE